VENNHFEDQEEEDNSKRDFKYEIVRMVDGWNRPRILFSGGSWYYRRSTFQILQAELFILQIIFTKSAQRDNS
jgi:hypothetical protein